jgi:hypothetical protein
VFCGLEKMLECEFRITFDAEGAGDVAFANAPRRIGDKGQNFTFTGKCAG